MTRAALYVKRISQDNQGWQVDAKLLHSSVLCCSGLENPHLLSCKLRFYSWRPALRPCAASSSCSKLHPWLRKRYVPVSLLLPAILSRPSRRVLPSLATFCINLLTTVLGFCQCQCFFNQRLFLTILVITVRDHRPNLV